MKHRIFTLDEANAVIEEVIQPAFERLHTGIRELARLERETAILGLIVDSGASRTNPDHSRHARLKGRVDATKDEIREEVDVIRKSGALIKDLRHGLVDFFALHDDRLVFLCWQRGEDQIRYWHPIDSGFQGRRPLDKEAEVEDTERGDV